jgi:acetolactate synthase-1/3 small subunit
MKHIIAVIVENKSGVLTRIAGLFSRVSELDPAESLERELAVIKVSVDRESRSEIMQIVNIFRARIIDVSQRSMIIEVTGDEEKVDAIIQLLRQFGIKELARTGKVSMVRGARVIKA